MEEKVFKGRTEDAQAPFLGADWWEKEKHIAGIVERVFTVNEKPAYVVKLLAPVALDGEEVEQVSIGNSAGFQMALQAAHLSGLRVTDRLHVVCTGKTPSKTEGFSPRVDFEIEVTRVT
jgi:hypothetical protein